MLSDFSEGMLKASKSEFNDGRMSFVQSDTQNLQFDKNYFDKIISTNSIIPETREQVLKMYSSIYRTLKPGGEFLAYLPSFTFIEEIWEYSSILSIFLGLEKKMDKNNARLWDTTGWQVFHSEDYIEEEISKAKFSSYKIDRVSTESEEELSELNKIYKAEMFSELYWGYYLEAKK